MLNLPCFDLPELTEVVSKQLSGALHEMFGISGKSGADREKVKDFLLRSKNIRTDDGIRNENLEAAAKQWEILYRHASDRKCLYIPDALEEFFLDETLKYFARKISRENWKMPGSPEQLRKIRELCLQDTRAAGTKFDSDWNPEKDRLAFGSLKDK